MKNILTSRNDNSNKITRTSHEVTAIGLYLNITGSEHNFTHAGPSIVYFEATTVVIFIQSAFACLRLEIAMSTTIDSPANCEVRVVMRFLYGQGSSAAETHRELCQVYGSIVTSEENDRKLCRYLKNGGTNVHDEERKGKPNI